MLAFSIFAISDCETPAQGASCACVMPLLRLRLPLSFKSGSIAPHPCPRFYGGFWLCIHDTHHRNPVHKKCGCARNSKAVAVKNVCGNFGCFFTAFNAGGKTAFAYAYPCCKARKPCSVKGLLVRIHCVVHLPELSLICSTLGCLCSFLRIGVRR